MKQNIGGMLKTLQTMQKRMDAIQTELAAAVYNGTSASGLVKVAMTGKGEILSVEFDPAVMTEDRETLQDLVTVAAKVAYQAKEAAAKEKLASVAGGLLPLGMTIPGLG